MTLSKAKIKYIRSLQHKKFRQKYNKFIVEGEKMVAELIGQSTIAVEEVYAVANWIGAHPAARSLPEGRLLSVTPAELAQISALTTPNQVLALASIPSPRLEADRLRSDYVLYLDGLRDPGNVGAILRIADWFAIPYVICSPDSVDLFNPKVIQASMGAFLRVSCAEMPFGALLDIAGGLPVIGAVLDGDNLFRASWPDRGVLVIGSEANGISTALHEHLTHRLSIPATAGGGAESLNAAVATGIICAVLRNAP